MNVPILSTIIKGAAYLDAATTTLSAVKGLGQGIFTGDWSGLGNAGKIFLGNFALNNKLPGLGGAWGGISRFSWEGIQQTLGYSFNQCYNTFNYTSVQYFDGATLVNRNATGADRWGLTMGSFIMGQNLKASTSDYVFMHEYGHTLQSQDWGPLYGLVIAPWSGLNMLFGGQRQINRLLKEHDTEWYEEEATCYASMYFEKYYNVQWHDNTNPRSDRVIQLLVNTLSIIK